ncbi:MAG: carbohydrate ABC transporter permease [Anaerorhabdus sp.]
MTKFKKIFPYIVLTSASLLSVFPLYYMISGATNKSIDIVRGKLFFGTYLFENFKTLINNQNLALALSNSFRNAIILTVLTLVICSIAGYGFEIYHSKRKDFLMKILLLAMMFPFIAIVTPLFKLFSNLKMINSMWAFMLPTISTPFIIMMFRQASRSFPKEIIDAARIDGLSDFKIFYKIFVPTMKSTYGAATTVIFMNAWNSYLWPKIIFQDNSSITIPMLVANLKSGYSVDYGMLMLGVLIATIPTAIVFFALQKHFADGITGSVK